MKDNDIGKMLVKYPWILSASILENLEKILGFFDEEKVLVEFRCLVPISRNLMLRNRYLSGTYNFFIAHSLGSKKLLLASNQKLATYFGLFS